MSMRSSWRGPVNLVPALIPVVVNWLLRACLPFLFQLDSIAHAIPYTVAAVRVSAAERVTTPIYLVSFLGIDM